MEPTSHNMDLKSVDYDPLDVKNRKFHLKFVAFRRRLLQKLGAHEKSARPRSGCIPVLEIMNCPQLLPNKGIRVATTLSKATAKLMRYVNRLDIAKSISHLENEIIKPVNGLKKWELWLPLVFSAKVYF